MGTDQDSNNNNDGGLNITLGKIIAYPIGILLILSGVGSLIESVAGGIIILFAGVLALPITRAKLKRSQGISINRWATGFIVIVLVIAGGSLLGGGGGGGGGFGSGVSDEPIDATTEEIMPEVDSLGSGWQIQEESEGSRTYIKTDPVVIVEVEMSKHGEIESAKEAYESRVNEETDDGRLGTDESNYGNEGIIIEPPADRGIIVFRAGDFVVMLHAALGSENFTSDPIREAENVADIIMDNLSNAQ